MLTGFLVTVAGWWAWNAFLSAVYAPGTSPYGVRDGFVSGFGRDPAWWLTLVIVLFVLGVAEMVYKTAKRQLVMAGSRNGLCSYLLWRVSGRSAPVAGSEGTGDTSPPWEWDVGLWQELEQDPLVRAQLCAATRGTGSKDDVLKGIAY